MASLYVGLWREFEATCGPNESYRSSEGTLDKERWGLDRYVLMSSRGRRLSALRPGGGSIGCAIADEAGIR